MVQLTHTYMITGKTTIWTSVGKVMSLLFNMLSRFVIAFLLKSKHLLISWLQSPSAVILEPPQNKVINSEKLIQELCMERWKLHLVEKIIDTISSVFSAIMYTLV